MAGVHHHLKFVQFSANRQRAENYHPETSLGIYLLLGSKNWKPIGDQYYWQPCILNMLYNHLWGGKVLPVVLLQTKKNTIFWKKCLFQCQSPINEELHQTKDHHNGCTIILKQFRNTGNMTAVFWRGSLIALKLKEHRKWLSANQVARFSPQTEFTETTQFPWSEVSQQVIRSKRIYGVVRKLAI